MQTTINSLDPSQKSALESILNGDSNNTVIYGPPGTGKSHLIVSLLFELAAKGKQVLFVSQNSEALNVIVRKYKELHEELGLGEQDLSFLDFCWRLNSPEQKRLKYLKNSFNNRTGKTTQNAAILDYGVRDGVSDNSAPYNLTYNELDIVKNSNVRPEAIGVDELATANIKYLAKEKNTPAILHNVDKIDTRYILKLLNNFKDPNHNFSSYNNPTNQLKFFSKSNRELTLGIIRSYADSICSVDDIVKNNTTYTVASDNITIQKYLEHLRQIATASSYVNIDVIKKKPTILDEIVQNLRSAISINNKQYAVEKISLPEGMNGDFAIKYQSELSTISDMKELAGVVKNRESLVRKLQALNKKYQFDVDASLDNLLAYCVKTIDFKYRSLFIKGDTKIFFDMNESDLRRLVSDINEYNKKGKLSKVFSSFPESVRQFKETMGDDIVKNADYINTFADVIKDTKYIVQNIYDLSRAKTEGMNFNPLEKIDLSLDDLVELTNYLIKIKESTPINLITEKSIKETIESCVDFNENAKIITEIIESNKIKADNIWLAVEKINQNALNNQYIAQIDQIYNNISPILIKRNRSTFIQDAEDIISYVSTNKEAILNSLNNISDIPAETAINVEKILELEKVLNDSLDSDIFSHDFYWIKNGENVKIWQKRVDTILNYNNIDEFEEYTSQMVFLDNLKEALTPANLKIIIDLLSEERVDYETFASYLTNDIVSSALYNMSKGNNPKMSNDYFEVYGKRVSEQKRLRYLRELRGMRADCAKEAQFLSYASNWFGNSVMEKIRNNTVHIIKAFPVVIATPSDVSKYIAAFKGVFNYVIFDEASQLLPGQALPSIYRAEKSVIVGDPHQMPPTAVSMLGGMATATFEEEDDEIGASILDIAVNLPDLESHHLKIHYRSESNKLFEPSLTAIYSQDGIRPIFEAKSGNLPIYIEDNIGEDDDRGFGVIIKRIEHYLNINPNASFCVLFSRGSGKGSLYEFKKYLESHPENTEKIMEMFESEKLLLSTVTNCQGIQGHHTIIYLPTYNVISRMWFFNEKAGAYKRLNVSITRQRKTLDVIMGDARNKWINACQAYIQSDNTPPNTLLSANLLNSLLTNAGQVIDEEYLRRTLDGNISAIDSPLTRELYEKLVEHYGDDIGKTINIWCEVGWNILVSDPNDYDIERKNVGYRVDIGIYSVARKRFILGIEMDGSVYHKGFNKEFSDLQRQDTLSRKGWRMYRIWSTNWLRDTRTEFDKLVSIIDDELTKEEPLEDINTPDDDYNIEDIDENEEDESAIVVDEPSVVNINIPNPAEPDKPVKVISREDIGQIMFELNLTKIVDQRLRIGAPLTITLADGHETRKIYLKKKESDGFLGAEEINGAVRKYKYGMIESYQE